MCVEKCEWVMRRKGRRERGEGLIPGAVRGIAREALRHAWGRMADKDEGLAGDRLEKCRLVRGLPLQKRVGGVRIDAGNADEEERRALRTERTYEQDLLVTASHLAAYSRLLRRKRTSSPLLRAPRCSRLTLSSSSSCSSPPLANVTDSAVREAQYKQFNPRGSVRGRRLPGRTATKGSVPFTLTAPDHLVHLIRAFPRLC